MCNEAGITYTTSLFPNKNTLLSQSAYAWLPLVDEIRTYWLEPVFDTLPECY